MKSLFKGGGLGSLMLLIFILFPLSVWATDPPKADSPKGAAAGPVNAEVAKIELFTKQMDFGSADEGETVSRTFTVKNSGKAELVIDKVSPS